MTWTKLHEAAEHLDVDTVMYRSHHNSEEAVSADEHGSTPLHIACFRNNPPLKLIQALIDACPQTVSDQDANGDTPLHIALSFPNVTPDMVKALLDACPTATSISNKEGLMPLHQACRYCPANERVIGLLLDVYPFATRSRIKMGELPPRRKHHDTLREARATDHFIMDGSPRTVTNAFDLRFQELGIQERNGSYPLHMAIASGAPRSVVEMLLVEAPDVVSLTNKFGETAFHVAVGQNKNQDEMASVVEALLATEQGCEAVRMADKNGNLPLHVAATHGCNDEVAKLLLIKYPQSIHVQNANGKGKTPLELAQESGKCDADVVHLLKISDELE